MHVMRMTSASHHANLNLNTKSLIPVQVSTRTAQCGVQGCVDTNHHTTQPAARSCTMHCHTAADCVWQQIGLQRQPGKLNTRLYPHMDLHQGHNAVHKVEVFSQHACLCMQPRSFDRSTRDRSTSASYHSKDYRRVHQGRAISQRTGSLLSSCCGCNKHGKGNMHLHRHVRRAGVEPTKATGYRGTHNKQQVASVKHMGLYWPSEGLLRAKYMRASTVAMHPQGMSTHGARVAHHASHEYCLQCSTEQASSGKQYSKHTEGAQLNINSTCKRLQRQKTFPNKLRVLLQQTKCLAAAK